MSKELNELRSQQDLEPRATSITSTDSGLSPNVTGNTAQSSSAALMDDFDLSAESVEIGGTVISAEVAIDAFKMFASLYHPWFPILGPININTIYQSSPFLFWSIIGIVATHTTIPLSEELFNQIAIPFQNMVRTEALQAPLPLQKIQALLLLCVWPMPVTNQPRDPSWLYCGIAVNSALYLGLHRPGPPPSFRPIRLSVGTPLERIMTWLGCFYISGSVSMHLGVPAILNSSSDLARITACLHDFPITRQFAAEIKLQAIITDFTNVLSHTANDGTIDSSILQLLDRELDDLRTSYPDQWTRMLEYSTLVAKLHMYALVISRDRTGNTARNILLKLSLSACLRIIFLANMRHNEEPFELYGLSAARLQRALPKAHFKGLAFTTAFLLRYFSLNSAASAEEQQMAANHVVLAHSIFKSCSMHPRDEWGRVAGSFEELCQQSPVSITSQQVQPGDRIGVTILMDAMRLASGVRRDTTSNTEPLVQPTTQPIPIDPSMNSFDAFGVSMAQPLDLWGNEMTFSGQNWGDPFWDAFNFPFMTSQFSPRQDG
ncbi:hypothetical protein F5Y19DRAFT_463337 [Xylariaceae sp. FL1651]|nr:hypothetical protein F5Y19DRAFT_463337 [Xylariaceae sp. FL1651]